MEDNQIIQLYWNRDQLAITATAEKYENYCKSIAINILGNIEDANECVNDTYLNTWNSIPTHHPDKLSAFLGKITRNLSFNKYNQSHTQKRGGSQLTIVLNELAECVSGKDSIEDEIQRKELAQLINRFLEKLPEEKRNIFICRYWYSDSVESIAKKYHRTEGSVTMILKRTREKLKKYITEGGFPI